MIDRERGTNRCGEGGGDADGCGEGGTSVGVRTFSLVIVRKEKSQHLASKYFVSLYYTHKGCTGHSKREKQTVGERKRKQEWFRGGVVPNVFESTS